MTRYVALLRAVNVGGRTIKMDALRAAFAELGFDDVATFIASGNVLFNASGRRGSVESRIETHLAERFDFEVATFLRTGTELESTRRVAVPGGVAHNVAFAKAPLTAAQSDAVFALETDIDRFVVEGAEIHWSCGRAQSESKFSNVRLERAIGGPTTMRNITTVSKLAARLGG